MGFRIWFTISTVVRKGLNLCILDMFDHTYSGLKKSKFLCVFAYRLSYLQVVKIGPNLCIYNNFNHTCSGLKKSKFLLFFASGLMYLQWLEKV